jgi:C-terminal processing protease CtpA/Prc
MINMDMIGRLPKEKASLAVSGTGTAAPIEKMIKGFENGALKINTDSAGVGPSDHTSFYNKGIPVLHFFSGTHADYHKPSDDIEKINAQGEEVILLIIAGLIEQLPRDEKLVFLKTRNPSMGTSAKFKVTLGIMPSYANTDDGLKVEAVLDGKAAMKAGMKDGDIITQIGDFPVKEIQTYMEALGKFNKGDKTKIKLTREKQEIVVEVEF